MHASDFILARERFIKAFIRGIIDRSTLYREMHVLFQRAQVSKGFADDSEKVDMLVHNFTNPQDKWL